MIRIDSGDNAVASGRPDDDRSPRAPGRGEGNLAGTDER